MLHEKNKINKIEKHIDVVSTKNDFEMFSAEESQMATNFMGSPCATFIRECPVFKGLS